MGRDYLMGSVRNLSAKELVEIFVGKEIVLTDDRTGYNYKASIIDVKYGGKENRLSFKIANKWFVVSSNDIPPEISQEYQKVMDNGN